MGGSARRLIDLGRRKGKEILIWETRSFGRGKGGRGGEGKEWGANAKWEGRGFKRRS